MTLFTNYVSLSALYSSHSGDPFAASVAGGTTAQDVLDNQYGKGVQEFFGEVGGQAIAFICASPTNGLCAMCLCKCDLWCGVPNGCVFFPVACKRQTALLCIALSNTLLFMCTH